MSIMTKDIDIKIEHLPTPKGFKKHKPIVKPMPFRWTVHEGKYIFTYGYCHTEKEAKKAAAEAYVRVTERKDRNVL